MQITDERAVYNMVEFEDYKVKINNLRPSLDVLKDALKLNEAEAEISKLEAESAADGFWNDIENSQKVMRKITSSKANVNVTESLRAAGMI